MNINQRFEKIINELYKGNKSAFAKSIGVAPTVIENIVGVRKGNPSFDVIYKTLYANANISAEWLILDTGEMLKSDSKTEIKHVDNEYMTRRFEELIVENTNLKREVDELLYTRGKSTGTITYNIGEKSGTHIAADSGTHKQT